MYGGCDAIDIAELKGLFICSSSICFSFQTSPFISHSTHIYTGGVDAENEERTNWINKERRRIQKSVDYVAQIRKDADARKAKNKDEGEGGGEGEEKKDGDVTHDEGLGGGEDEVGTIHYYNSLNSF